ncbi:G patch domain-containing protein 4 [Pyxicephalus adspersus]|uniref:G patch domain-containing protein 4 n=1 Tax=Pyxicephalus adspersus TaxID=30357 RepID=A0AAV2ZKB5_PYXAD|nr:TPA: hypothetical protein GDO54_005004 [Pyxicephalus adspersus]
MAATPGGKSQGMKFAEEQLQRHGWTEGKGLGKRESGISEAIKVKVKCDTAGVGHNSAEQFTFHWWDHVFNKTASSISVEPDQDGVQVKKVTDEDSTVTNKKPRKALTNRDMLYGRFIKSATLLSEGEKPVEKESSSDSSDSSEDEDEKLDLSSATKLTDDDLVKICGGRTAHKGARHGLTMSAKLSRIEEQERAFLEKYGKKEPVGPLGEKDTETGSKKKKYRPDITDEDVSSDTTQRKKKKKRKKAINDKTLEEKNGDEEHNPWPEEDTTNSKSNMDNEELGDASKDLKSSRKKKKKVADKTVLEEADDLEDAQPTEDNVQSSKKKKRKAEKGEEGSEELLNGHQDWAPSDVRPSKKKKKSKRDFKEKVEEEQDESTEERIQSAKKKKKQKKVEEVDEEQHLSMEDEECQTRKKKKKSKTKSRDCSIAEKELE